MELHTRVEGLKALGLLAKRSQDQIAGGLGVKQAAAPMRRFVEAAGGTRELRVTLPGQGVMSLTGLGELGG